MKTKMETKGAGYARLEIGIDNDDDIRDAFAVIMRQPTAVNAVGFAESTMRTLLACEHKPSFIMLETHADAFGVTAYWMHDGRTLSIEHYADGNGRPMGNDIAGIDDDRLKEKAIHATGGTPDESGDAPIEPYIIDMDVRPSGMFTHASIDGDYECFLEHGRLNTHEDAVEI